MLLKTYKRIGILFSLFLLIGCETANIKQDYVFDTKKNTGLVIGSLTQDNKSGANNAYSLYYIQPDNTELHYEILKSREEKYWGLLPAYEKSDFSDSNGRIFAIELKEGLHRVTSWKVNNGSGAHISPKNAPPALELNVVSGEILYIGNIHMHLLTGENVFGLNITGDAAPEISNMSERDIALFKKKYPSLNDRTININPLHNGPWYSEEGFETHKEITIQPPVNVK